MAANSIIPAFEKLTGRENYNDWSFAMRAYLEHEDLWSCILGTDSTQDPDEKVKRDIRAKSKIIMMTSSENFVHIRNAQTAKEVWDNLKKAFQDSGLTRKVSLMKKLITTRLDECSSIEEYIATIMSTAQKLNDISFEVTSEWIGTFLLAGLPDRYNPMVMAIENSNVTISADYVKTKLLQDLRGEPTSSDNSAFYAGKNHSTIKPKRPKPRCYNCNNIGHLAIHCHKPNRKFKNKYKKASDHEQTSLFSAFSQTHKISNHEWYLDSGASAHMTPHKEILINNSVIRKREVTFADGHAVSISEQGDCLIKVKNRSAHASTIKIKNILFVPNLATNLLSVSQITNSGKKVIFHKNNCYIYDTNGTVIATAFLKDNMYKLNTCQETQEKSYMSKVLPEVWHRRLGHLNTKYMHELQNITGIQLLDKNFTRNKCVTCLKAKQTKLPFHKSKSTTKDLLQLIHSDLCGPMETKSIGGSKYILTFLDDYSHMIFVYFLKHKDEVTEKFREFKNMVENQCNKKIKHLRTDNGREYINQNLINILKKSGIIHQTTIAYNPQQNGKAERINRSLLEKAKCLLEDSQLPKRFWAEAVNTAAYLLNRSPTSAIKSNKVPLEIWTNKRVDISNLRIFGSKVLVQIPKLKRQKLDANAEESIFVGYSLNQKGYRVFNPKTNKVIVTRDIIFLDEMYNVKLNETKLINKEQKYIQISEPTQIQETEATMNDFSEYDDTSNELDETFQSPVILTESDEEFQPANSFQNINEINQSTPIALRKTSRAPKPNQKKDYIYFTYSSTLNDPSTVEEALSGANRDLWKKAMDEEYNSLIENNTWTLTDMNPGQKPIKSKWIFKTKRNQDGTVRYKARLVIKGCSQKYGIDYSETYAPVVKLDSIRYLLALSIQQNFSIDHMDATTAFLQGELKETIYMEQPEGYKNNSMVCKLNKSLYGLKQSSRVWNQKLHKVLIELGLKNSKTDCCIYYYISGKNQMYVAVYVDDLVIFANNTKVKNHLKEKLQSYFKMKDLGPINNYLGIRIKIDKDKNRLTLDQEEYINEVLKRFNMENSHPVSTPVDINVKFNTDSGTSLENIPYKAAVGCLLYIAHATRPDIMFAVNLISRFANNPNKEHWTAVKRILRYLKGTISYKLEYCKTEHDEIYGYCDADWASDVKDRRSTTGYIFFKGGSAISWNTCKQQTVARSTTEAEYMAMATATEQALWLRNLNEELNQPSSIPILIYADNISAINLASNNGYNQRSKHIDIRHHFIKERITNNQICFKYISSEEMIADIFTKGLSKQSHEKFRLLMNINLREDVRIY